MPGRKSPADPARAYCGNRLHHHPARRADPQVLGALLAIYRHRTFTNGVLMGINSFDQFGDELGKDIARSIEKDGAQGLAPSTMALIELALE